MIFRAGFAHGIKMNVLRLPLSWAWTLFMAEPLFPKLCDIFATLLAAESGIFQHLVERRFLPDLGPTFGGAFLHWLRDEADRSRRIGLRPCDVRHGRLPSGPNVSQ
jgi:hypothetical protein